MDELKVVNDNMYFSEMLKTLCANEYTKSILASVMPLLLVISFLYMRVIIVQWLICYAALTTVEDAASIGARNTSHKLILIALTQFNKLFNTSPTAPLELINSKIRNKHTNTLT